MSHSDRAVMLYDSPVLLTRGATMEHWHVDPISGMMISMNPSGNWFVAIPNRGVLAYSPEEVEHVTYVTKPPNPGTTTRNPRH